MAARIPRLRERAAWKALEAHLATMHDVRKVLAGRIIPQLGSPEAASLSHDTSTNALIRHYRRLAGR